MLKKMKAITFTYQLMIKFLTSTGVGKVRGDQKVVRQCFITTMKANTSKPSAKQQLQIDDAEMDALRDEVEDT